MNRTIIPKNGIYDFSFEPIIEYAGSPVAFIGRHICSLLCFEKENPLIKKLLERIRKPSTKEALQLSHDFAIDLKDGICRLKSKETGGEVNVFNLGTVTTPAFFYERFVFVFNPRDKTFTPVALRIVSFNEKYAVILLPQNLLIKYDIKGLGVLGNFVSITSVPKGYILVAQIGDNQTVYALTQNFQKLFETEDRSKFSVSEQDGIVTREQLNSASYVINQYIPSKNGYELEKA